MKGLDQFFFLQNGQFLGLCLLQKIIQENNTQGYLLIFIRFWNRLSTLNEEKV